jgi:dihydroxy-acid dehydratase
LTPRPPDVGIPFFEPSAHPDVVLAAGAEPVPLRLPTARPPGGVALAREWVADATEVSCAGANLDALLLASDDPEQLFGMLLAAARLGLPAVCDAPPGTPLSAALTALGFSPPSGNAAGVAAGTAPGGPRPGGLLDNFSLANALRAGVAAGGGPGLLIHLSALAREAGVAGFGQMVRVLAPETPAAAPAWVAEHGVPALLAALGDALHDGPTVSGQLKKGLPSAPPTLDGAHRFVFVRARASGGEALCRAPAGVLEAAGGCRVFSCEGTAVRAVRAGEVGSDALLVVLGCGPRGGPGLLRLDALGAALGEAGLATPVVTDGLAPEGVAGLWASLFSPEAAVGGVMGRLRDGDGLRLDLGGGRIRTDVGTEEFTSRKPSEPPSRAGAGYAARYARSALPALEGAGFG